MKVIEASNVNIAYAKALSYMNDFGIKRESRAGEVLVVPEPVTTHYRNPRERVLFSTQRDANPFFHLFEALWMLTGANDVQLPKYFVKRMENFSDDGEVFHGAYGHRWRHFPVDDLIGDEVTADQLDQIVWMLQKNPDDRRVILQIWDAARDLGTDSADIPCNDMVKFELAPGVNPNVLQLNMVVFNRSNDIIWGCYGANAVQFSVLQEYLASRLGVPVGWYEQVSTNWHAYLNVWHDYYPNTDTFPFKDPYRGMDEVKVEPLVTDADTFDTECQVVINHARNHPHIIGEFITENMHNRFFHKVCGPMLWSYGYYRHNDLKKAIEMMEKAILDNGEIDWLVAGERWMRRRAAKRLVASESTVSTLNSTTRGRSL